MVNCPKCGSSRIFGLAEKIIKDTGADHWCQGCGNDFNSETGEIVRRKP